MVKFHEVFEFLSYRSQEMRCDCCKLQREGATLYKHKDGVTMLCDNCRDFIQELLDE